MTISQIENISQIFLILAIVFAVISIILFFVFDIRRILKISNRRYLKDTEQVSLKKKKDDVKKYQEDIYITEDLLNDYAGDESTELISGKQTESYIDKDEATVLLTHRGSDPTEPLDTESVSVLQDIIYINDYTNT